MVSPKVLRSDRLTPEALCTEVSAVGKQTEVNKSAVKRARVVHGTIGVACALQYFYKDYCVR